jgi:hypothetical protein
MGVFAGVVVPLALAVLAFMLGRRELALYREGDEFGSDLFVYSKGRLWRRMTGIGVLVALALTLVALEFLPFRSGPALSIYVALLVTEVAALVVLPLIDLWETAKTADSADLTRQGDPDRRTRSRPRRPR